MRNRYFVIGKSMGKRIFSVILIMMLILSLCQTIMPSHAAESVSIILTENLKETAGSEGAAKEEPGETVPGNETAEQEGDKSGENEEEAVDTVAPEEDQSTAKKPVLKKMQQDSQKTVEVTTEETLRQAVVDAGSTPTTILLGAHIGLTGNPLEIPTSADITLEGSYQLRGPNNQAAIDVNGVLTLGGITVTHNTGQSGSGIKVSPGASLDVNSGSVSGSTTADNGGGIHNNGGKVTVKSGGTVNGTVGNATTPQNGGGIYNTGSGEITIEGGTINGTALGTTAIPGMGGGIYNDAGRVNVKSGGTVTGTLSGSGPRCRGGGIYNNKGTVTIQSSGKVSGTACGTTTVASIGMGGGIYNDSGTIHIESNGIVSGTTNNSAGRGGGVYNNSGTVNIKSGGTVSGVAGGGTNSEGGGIYNVSSAAGAAHINIDGGNVSGTVTATASSHGPGGGIYNSKPSTTTNDAVVNVNTAASSAVGTVSGTAEGSGGAIQNMGATVHINNLGKVSGGTAGNYGGGIYNGSGGTAFIHRGGAISGNNASQNGGGIYHNGSGLHIDEGAMIGGTNATDGNTAVGRGGGIYTNNIGGTLTISGSVLNNKAGENGGGIYNGNTAAIVLKNATIAGNTAGDDGGGVYIAYANLKNLSIDTGINSTDSGTVFSNNSASVAYNRNPTDDSLYHAHIYNSSWTNPFKQGYNNYDISYKNGEPTEIYTVTFDFNDGESQNKTHQVLSGDSLGENMPKDPTRSGYAFKGWNTAPDGSDMPFTKETSVDNDITVYAQWEADAPPPTSTTKPDTTPATTTSDNTQTSTGENTTTTEGNKQTNEDKTPGTGDPSGFPAYLWVLLVAAATGIIVDRKKKGITK